MRSLSVLLLGLSLWGTAVQAKNLEFTVTNKKSYDLNLNDYDENYFSIEEVTVEELNADELMDMPASSEMSSNKSLGEFLLSADKLIAFGKKVWKIVEDGKPVNNLSMNSSVSVLPKVEDPQAAFYEMEHWSAPRVKRYRVDYTNFYGMKVISFEYTVRFDYGGQYQDKGRYLNAVTVEANEASVAWGFKFNAKNDVVSITNRGSLEDPVASLTMKVSYEADSIVKNIKASENFYVTGEGVLQKN